MKKIHSMKAKDFWVPAGWGLFVGLLAMFIFGLNSCAQRNDKKNVTEQAIFWNQYKEALFESVLGQGQEREWGDNDHLAAARIIGHYIKDQQAQGQNFKQVLKHEEEQRYLWRNVNNQSWSNSAREGMTPAIMAMITCPYWQTMARGAWDRQVIEQLLSGELKTLPPFAQPPAMEKIWIPSWWAYVVSMQFTAFLFFFIYLLELDESWYRLPGGWPGRTVIFLAFSPGAWPWIALASIGSLIAFLFRKRGDHQKNPVTPLNNQGDLLDKLQTRLKNRS